MKILLADDHALYRDAMAQVVRQLAGDVNPLQAHDWNSALGLAASHPDIALAVLDLGMPGMEPFDGLRTFLERTQVVPVVIVSASESMLDIRQALDAGAMGYITKSESTPVILRALELVLSGGIYVPPRLLRKSPSGMGNPADLAIRDLTPRQIGVLQAIAQGKSNKEIAQELGLSVATIKAHVGAIYKVLNVTRRFDAVRTAESVGLIRD
jgi:DNA-binding NarL/FixJ family response regulator